LCARHSLNLIDELWLEKDKKMVRVREKNDTSSSTGDVLEIYDRGLTEKKYLAKRSLSTGGPEIEL